MCTKKTALRDVSQDKYSTRLCLVLYLSLNTLPHAVFSMQTCGSALSNIKGVHKCMQNYAFVLLSDHVGIKRTKINSSW